MRRRLIGVIGSSVGTPAQLHLAESVGRLIAQRGAVLLCGGMAGVMEAAARGAHAAGGLTMGILPGANAYESPPNEFIEIALFTGMREGRNYLIACASEGLIAIGGGYGTLSEIALGLRMGKPVILLESWQFQMSGEPIHVPNATTAEEAVELLWTQLR
ncbi:MAG: TIGR00725 family protein [Fimbriimonadales bacterium]|nr:MAG: TIGR00725 family protein [Fimbriimonadales bacterium]GIV10082.1 MAG: TIGR00725 family protein [Fimbriimonadales bacterium]